jgi:hypothetical protein
MALERERSVVRRAALPILPVVAIIGKVLHLGKGKLENGRSNGGRKEKTKLKRNGKSGTRFQTT